MGCVSSVENEESNNQEKAPPGVEDQLSESYNPADLSVTGGFSNSVDVKNTTFVKQKKRRMFKNKANDSNKGKDSVSGKNSKKSKKFRKKKGKESSGSGVELMRKRTVSTQQEYLHETIVLPLANSVDTSKINNKNNQHHVVVAHSQETSIDAKSDHDHELTDNEKESNNNDKSNYKKNQTTSKTKTQTESNNNNSSQKGNNRKNSKDNNRKNSNNSNNRNNSNKNTDSDKNNPNNDGNAVEMDSDIAKSLSLKGSAKNNNNIGSNISSNNSSIHGINKFGFLRQKRVVFISLTQLNNTIDDIPDDVLESSIWLFKAERYWFYPSSKLEQKEASQSIVGTTNFNERFKTTLKIKDENGLVFWFGKRSTWNDISSKFEKIIDLWKDCVPTSIATLKKRLNLTDSDFIISENNSKIIFKFGNKHKHSKDKNKNDKNNKNSGNYDELEIMMPQCYDPLILDVDWWDKVYRNNKNGIESKYMVSADKVIHEIKKCEAKFASMMEILYQSNKNLIPMKSFSMLEWQESMTNDDYMLNNLDSIRLNANSHIPQPTPLGNVNENAGFVIDTYTINNSTPTMNAITENKNIIIKVENLNVNAAQEGSAGGNGGSSSLDGGGSIDGNGNDGKNVDSAGLAIVKDSQAASPAIDGLPEQKAKSKTTQEEASSTVNENGTVMVPHDTTETENENDENNNGDGNDNGNESNK